MDRCAVFVDAGYLGESAKVLLTEGSAGRRVRADRPALVTALADLAVKDTGLPLLRLYWYDAAPNRVPFPDQRELGRLSDVKLRLGNLRERDGGRRTQKGVDADLHADMTELARNKAAADFVLLTGDEDLLRAVEEVQKYGVRLHLWGVDSPPESSNQSLELIMAADRRRVLDASFLRALYTVFPDPAELAAKVAEVAAASDREAAPHDEAAA
ncbi:MAG: NYN domain-containing protein, partial [Actinomycetes bacterium]